MKHTTHSWSKDIMVDEFTKMLSQWTIYNSEFQIQQSMKDVFFLSCAVMERKGLQNIFSSLSLFHQYLYAMHHSLHLGYFWKQESCEYTARNKEVKMPGYDATAILPSYAIDYRNCHALTILIQWTSRLRYNLAFNSGVSRDIAESSKTLNWHPERQLMRDGLSFLLSLYCGGQLVACIPRAA